MKVSPPLVRNELRQNCGKQMSEVSATAIIAGVLPELSRCSLQVVHGIIVKCLRTSQDASVSQREPRASMRCTCAAVIAPDR